MTIQNLDIQDPTKIITEVIFGSGFGVSVDCSGVVFGVNIDDDDDVGGSASALTGCNTDDVERPIAKAGTPPGENFRGFGSRT